ncbi:hypothetical protein PND79_02650 [Flavonifractor plautii]|jgi:hypothetical protein|uniref:hypothetical protein n=1 Tax=Flavonifractor plautii TaxID=292800 RepID=UPI0018991CEC|nr:hypothetical protein [Flavonifractor plautii]MDB7910296.1 hypothetical protein [Flavonifractor plautii]MDB7913847.1 hypothetical protein [Flavonifractor plautii]
MDDKRKQSLLQVEALGAECGWVTPLTQDDRDFIAYFRSVFKRYNIVPSKATELEYEFVTKVAESEFYEKRAQA